MLKHQPHTQRTHWVYCEEPPQWGGGGGGGACGCGGTCGGVGVMDDGWLGVCGVCAVSWCVVYCECMIWCNEMQAYDI